MPTPEPIAEPARVVAAAVLDIFAHESMAGDGIELVAVQLERGGPVWSVQDGAVVPA